MAIKASASLMRVLLLAAVLVSAMLWVDYTSALPSFCDAQGGCGAVRASGYSYVAGVPLPAIGAFGIFALLLLSLFRSTTIAATFLVSITLAALGAAVLLVVQAFVIGAYCQLCIIVDVCVIVAAALAWLSRKHLHDRLLAGWSWAALAALLMALPFVVGNPTQPYGPPDTIKSFFVEGKTNVVLFADFACPHCRSLHPKLLQAIDTFGKERVHLKSIFHERHAANKPIAYARAYLCAAQQGRDEEMADVLFRSQDGPIDLRSAAVDMGVGITEFESCLVSDKTAQSLKDDDTLMHQIGLSGFPTVFIGAKALQGDVSIQEIEDALTSAASGQPDSARNSQRIIYGFVGLGIVAILAFGRIRRSPRAD